MIEESVLGGRDPLRRRHLFPRWRTGSTLDNAHNVCNDHRWLQDHSHCCQSFQPSWVMMSQQGTARAKHWEKLWKTMPCCPSHRPKCTANSCGVKPASRLMNMV